MPIILGVGDMGACSESGEVVKTYALGSCVALCLYDPRQKIAGMAHVALPESSIKPDQAKTKPGRFADTAVPALMQQMTDMGCRPRGRGLQIKLVGGAQILNMVAKLGERNELAIKKWLWKMGLGPQAQDVGGTESRTAELFVDTGRLRITAANGETWDV